MTTRDQAIGSRWLGWLGVAVVLTGLVLFANHAYTGGPGQPGRVAVLLLLYAAAAGVLLLGLRRERGGAHRGDARALIAGALASIYYTSYAAHHLPALRVLASPWPATALLLLCAALIVALGRRLRLPQTALLAVLLAAFAGIVGNVTTFTLVSNAILAAAFLFLVRNGWSPAALGFVTTLYLTLGYRLVLRDGWVTLPLHLGTRDFWRTAALVIFYWAVFAAATFLSRDQRFTEPRRAAFLALNGGAAWALTGLIVPRSQPRLFAVSLAVFALLLLLLAALLSRLRPAWALLHHSARTQAVVLVIVGAATLWTGHGPALILALLALALAMAGQHADSDVLRGLTVLVGLAAAGLGCLAAAEAGPAAWTLGGLLAFSAFWVERHEDSTPRFNPGAAFFSALAVAVWLAAVMALPATPGRPVLLAALAVASAAAAHAVGILPAAYLAQAFLVAAFAAFLAGHAGFSGPAWTVLAIVAATLALGTWWRRRRAGRAHALSSRIVRVLYAAALAGVLFVWLRWQFPSSDAAAWIVVPLALALLALLYAMIGGEWAVGVVFQAFLLAGLVQFALRWDDVPRPRALVMLAPVLALIAIATALGAWRARSAAATPASAARLSGLARALAAFLFVAWVYRYVPEHLRFLLLEASAVLLLVWAARRRDAVDLALSTLLSTGAVVLFWVSLRGLLGFGVADLLAFALLLAQQQLWRRRYPDFVPSALHDPAMVIGVMSLWRWVHLLVIRHFGAPWTPAGWALLAFVVCGLGFLLHEGRYRQLGYAILAATLLDVGLRDRTELPAWYRLAGVWAVGLVLLALAFLYERHRDAAARTRAAGPR